MSKMNQKKTVPATLTIEYEQGGKEKADYGTNVLSRLARDLTERYGRGFSRSNVVYMRKLYMTYPNSQTLPDQSEHMFMPWKYSCFDIKRTQAKAVDILANAV